LSRLDPLCAIGRIEPAFELVDGETVRGYVALPNRLWKPRGSVSSALSLTGADVGFLRAIGVAVDADDIRECVLAD
jgi:hypothetical protein